MMKRILPFITLIPVVVMLFVIFGFSAENAEESSSTSQKVVVAVAEVIVKDFDELPKSEADAIIKNLTHYIRKLAHFSEFFILGFFSAIHFLTIVNFCKFVSFPKILPISWIFCSLTAVIDELHQLFVPGRGCGFADMMIDSMGSLAGILVLLLIIVIIHKKVLFDQVVEKWK